MPLTQIFLHSRIAQKLDTHAFALGLIGFLLFGGQLSNDLLKQLTKLELKELPNIRKLGGDYEESIYIDSCIEKRIKSKKLLNWSSIPFFVPQKIIRILKKAVTHIEHRYTNVSEFLAALASARSSLPDWITTDQGYELRNWKGNDYLLTDESGQIKLKKKGAKSILFRTDNRITAQNYKDAYEQLKQLIGLP